MKAVFLLNISILVFLTSCAPKDSSDFIVAKITEESALISDGADECVPEETTLIQCNDENPDGFNEFASEADLLQALFLNEVPRCVLLDEVEVYEGFDPALECLVCVTTTEQTGCDDGGSTGDNGSNGDNGMNGNNGANGDNGMNGNNESNGNNGMNGNNGNNGSSGNNGGSCGCTPNIVTHVQCNNDEHPAYDKFADVEELLNQAFTTEEGNCIKLDNSIVYEGLIPNQSCFDCIKCITVSVDLNNCGSHDDDDDDD